MQHYYTHNIFNFSIFSISFCDLAGSERLKKTMNIGERLTESKNINTSLLVLNKCFSVLRYVYILLYMMYLWFYCIYIILCIKVKIKNVEKII